MIQLPRKDNSLTFPKCQRFEARLPRLRVGVLPLSYTTKSHQAWDTTTTEWKSMIPSTVDREQVESLTSRDPTANHQPRSGIRPARDLQRNTTVHMWSRSSDQRSLSLVIGAVARVSLTKWTKACRSRIKDSERYRTCPRWTMTESGNNIHAVNNMSMFLPVWARPCGTEPQTPTDRTLER